MTWASMVPAGAIRRILGPAVLALAVMPAVAGGSLTLRAGEQKVIALPGNPGTGYEWEYDAGASANPQVVEVSALGYQSTPGGRPGAPSHYRFRIRALAAGKATLAFSYRRPWESVPPLRRQTYVIEVGR